MGQVKALALAILLISPASTSARSVSDWRPFIAEASARFGLPVEWIEQVMRAESGGRTTLGGRPITSHAGAMGLMQVMPGTWAEMRTLHRLGANPHDPRDNIIAGAAYLRAMYDRFGYPGMFAAYNAGPSRYAEHLAGRRRLPLETRNYLVKVAGTSIDATPVGRAPPASQPAASRVETLFVALGQRAQSAQAQRAGTPSPSLFVIQSPR